MSLLAPLGSSPAPGAVTPPADGSDLSTDEEKPVDDVIGLNIEPPTPTTVQKHAIQCCACAFCMTCQGVFNTIEFIGALVIVVIYMTLPKSLPFYVNFANYIASSYLLNCGLVLLSGLLVPGNQYYLPATVFYTLLHLFGFFCYVILGACYMQLKSAREVPSSKVSGLLCVLIGIIHGFHSVNNFVTRTTFLGNAK